MALRASSSQGSVEALDQRRFAIWLAEQADGAGRKGSAGFTRGPEIERGLAFLLKNRPNLKGARPDMHYFFGHYHAALATWAAGGEFRRKWYEPARDELIARQTAGGNWLDPISAHCGTAMALIALQVPNGQLSPEF